MRQPECYLCEKWTGGFWVEDNPVTDQHICEGCYQAALEELEKEAQADGRLLVQGVQHLETK